MDGGYGYFMSNKAAKGITSIAVLSSKAGEPSDHAAAFFVLGTIAEAFVERHERMPLLSKETEQSFAAFKEEMHAGGAAAKELLPLHLKSRGSLVSRLISYDGVRVRVATHRLSRVSGRRAEDLNAPKHSWTHMFLRDRFNASVLWRPQARGAPWSI